jgi:hypothetical protein
MIVAPAQGVRHLATSCVARFDALPPVARFIVAIAISLSLWAGIILFLGGAGSYRTM